MNARLASTPETWLFLGVGGLCLLLLQHGAFAVPAPAMLLGLLVAVVLTGVPHGALDPWVARRAGLWRTPRGLIAFNLAYVAVGALVLVAWQRAPGASLALFLLLSAWHFGGDWQPWLDRWTRAPVGAALLALPALGAPEQVRAIFTVLAGDQGGMLAAWLGRAAPWLAAAAGASALLALRRSFAAAVEMLAVAAFALLMPPLVFFLVYFCALHSPRHLRAAAQSDEPARRRSMAAVAAAYTLLTVVMAAAAWPWLAGAATTATASGDTLTRVLFIGLAALTLPHMIVMMLCERRRSTRP